jgi:two-component system, chemotaxis family, protein-glutamate methylesterase/glutaminase
VSGRVRVLVVDDSAFARKVLREALGARPELEVVDVARDGLEALEKVATLRPDVLTLDLVMPGLDGLGVLRALPKDGAPRVVVVSVSPADSELGAAALEAGAVDLVQKPTALATDRLYDLSAELVAKVLAAAKARPLREPYRVRPAPAVAAARHAKVLVVGTSTGGPQALSHLLRALPANLPVPMAVALHIPVGYTDALAQRLDHSSELEVREASEGLVLRPGRCVLARGGIHLRLRRSEGEAMAALGAAPLSSLHAPSVDILFESAVEAYGGQVLAVVLTGMGDDGLLGARRVRAAGGRVLAEAESTCVVYGMPRVVAEAGLATEVAPLDGMAEAILRHL